MDYGVDSTTGGNIQLNKEGCGGRGRTGKVSQLNSWEYGVDSTVNNWGKYSTQQRGGGRTKQLGNAIGYTTVKRCEWYCMYKQIQKLVRHVKQE